MRKSVQDQPVPRPVAVITGAAQEIGLLSAKRLAATHRVALLDLQAEKLPQAAAECGEDAIQVACDITQQDQVEAAVAEVVSQAGGIDVIISNAGIAVGGSLRLLDPDAVAAQMNVNLTGNWRVIQACLPHVIERRGYVLGVASAAAIAPTPSIGAYCASKAALEMLLDVLYLEVAPLGVDVGVAYFTFTDTDMVRQADRYCPAFEYMHKNQPWPLNKLFRAEAAADAIVAAVRGRKRRAFSPGWARWLSRFRMLLRTKTASRINLKLIPRIDELTAETVAQRGPFGAAMAITPACDAAADSIGRSRPEPEGGEG
jgi:NAD(P)-dependent dehydrogenase (short-subunit alcohol dehydrogenase family)